MICKVPIIFLKSIKYFIIFFSRCYNCFWLILFTINDCYRTKLSFNNNLNFFPSDAVNMRPSIEIIVSNIRSRYCWPFSLDKWVRQLQNDDHLIMEQSLCCFVDVYGFFFHILLNHFFFLLEERLSRFF